MIPAHGYVAIYVHQRDGREYVVRRPVIAWHTDTGRPLVVDPEEHMLVPAHTIAGFDGLRQAPKTAYVSGGGGWMATYTDANGQRTAPVVAWGVDDFGQVYPRVYCEPDDSDINDTKVWHPDHGQT